MYFVYSYVVLVGDYMLVISDFGGLFFVVIVCCNFYGM